MGEEALLTYDIVRVREINEACHRLVCPWFDDLKRGLGKRRHLRLFRRCGWLILLTSAPLGAERPFELPKMGEIESEVVSRAFVFGKRQLGLDTNAEEASLVGRRFPHAARAFLVRGRTRVPVPIGDDLVRYRERRRKWSKLTQLMAALRLFH